MSIEASANNGTYYLTVYHPLVGSRKCTYRQEIGAPRTWLTWLTDHPDWQSLHVLEQPTPGPPILAAGSDEWGKTTTMWKFLVAKGVLTEPPHPLYATYGELEGPPDELAQSIRDDLTILRGKLQDLMHAYPIWKDWLKAPEGGITCVISSLYGGVQEMQKHRSKWGHKPDWLRPRHTDE